MRAPTVSDAVSLAVVGAAAWAAFELHAATPALPTASEPLDYTGVVHDAYGREVRGAHVIGIDFWDAADGGARLCSVGPQAVDIAHGQFRVAMPDDCAALQRAQEIWSDVQIDGDHLIPRARLEHGHVVPAPHAPEAQPERPTVNANGSQPAPEHASPQARPEPADGEPALEAGAMDPTIS